jgi:hypothetical protein
LLDTLWERYRQRSCPDARERRSAATFVMTMSVLHVRLPAADDRHRHSVSIVDALVTAPPVATTLKTRI